MSPKARRFTNGFNQRGCRACGGPNHQRSVQPCISVETFVAIRDFAEEHGRNWRADLRALWDSGKDEGPLRSARNAIGPSRLSKVFPEKIVVNEAARAALKAKLSRGEA